MPFTEWKFKEGRAAGFNVFRFFALGNNNDDRNNPNRLNYALQPQPGKSTHIFDDDAASTAFSLKSARANQVFVVLHQSFV